jgi:DNA-binding NarL/FixJ family response regulator
MLTIRATLNNGNITFLDQVDLSLWETDELQILITFLDINISPVDGNINIRQDESTRKINQYKLGVTKREIEVLNLVGKGLTNEQISDQLELGSGTVRNYLSGIYEKLNAPNRTGAVAKAKELGLID